MKLINRFERDDQILKIHITRKNGDSFVVLADADDYELLSKHQWFLRNCSGKFYVTTNNSLYMHRLLLKEPKIVDHINRNTLDNRKDNLRPSNYSLNAANCGVHSHSKTKVKGVYRRGDCNRYQAFITVNKKINYLGLFKTIEEASLARNEFISRLNIPEYRS